MLKTMASGPSSETERAAVRTVACLDVRLSARPSDGRRDGTTPSLPESALHRIQGAVRADDRVCPIGTSKVAVEFGPVANSVPPQVLGYRLAQAIGRDLPPDAVPRRPGCVGRHGRSRRRPRRLRPHPPGAGRLRGRALPAGEAPLCRHPGLQHGDDRGPTRAHASAGSPSALPPMHRRSVSRYRVGREPGAFVPLSPAAESLVPASGDTATTDLTVLVIDLPGRAVRRPRVRRHHRGVRGRATGMPVGGRGRHPR